MRTSQMQFLSEMRAGHDGPPIPESTRVYFQQRLRNRFFEFLLNKFLEQQALGLTKAKLARRIGKTPDVVNRWLSAPSNLTLDTASDLLLGISAEEPMFASASLLNRSSTNFNHLDGEDTAPRATAQSTDKTKSDKLVQPDNNDLFQSIRSEARAA